MNKTIEQLQQEYADNEVKIQQEKHIFQRAASCPSPDGGMSWRHCNRNIKLGKRSFPPSMPM